MFSAFAVLVGVLSVTSVTAQPSCIDAADKSGQSCCANYRDEGDVVNGRYLQYEPDNCNVAGGYSLLWCRAHGVDGCRFCFLDCSAFEAQGIECYQCDPDLVGESSLPPTFAPTTAPAPAPLPGAPTSPVITPPAPTPSTPAPTVEATPAGTVDFEAAVNCAKTFCVTTAAETDALNRREKTLVCDETCLFPNISPTFGTALCNYFGLGQICRACKDDCSIVGGGYVDSKGVECVPCNMIGL